MSHSITPKSPDESAVQEVRQQTRVLQIVVVALAMGLGMFLVISLTVLSAPEPEPWNSMNYIAFGFAGLLVVLSLFIPPAIGSAIRTRIMQDPASDQAGLLKTVPGRFAQSRMTQTIIAGALLEGPGFLNCIAYSQTGQVTHLAVAAGLILCILLKIPTQDGMQHWIESEIQGFASFRDFDTSSSRDS